MDRHKAWSGTVISHATCHSVSLRYIYCLKRIVINYCYFVEKTPLIPPKLGVRTSQYSQNDNGKTVTIIHTQIFRMPAM